MRYLKTSFVTLFLTHCLTVMGDQNIAQFCSVISRNLDLISMAECENLPDHQVEFYTVENRPIVRFLIPASHREPLAKILVIGGIHGDELASVEMALRWLNRLANSGGNEYQWLVMPAINLDVLNRPKRVRMNRNGVDLNRNFPPYTRTNISPHTHWLIDQKDKRFYPGKTPLSEPETQAIVATAKRFNPDLIIALHAPYELIDFDGLPTDAPQNIGGFKLKLLPSYPGSLGSYFWKSERIPVLTFEFSQNAPSEQKANELWSDLEYWLEGLFNPLMKTLTNEQRFNRGLKALSLNRYALAEKFFSEIESDPVLFLSAQNNLAYALYRQGKIKQSLTIWDQLIEKNQPLMTVIENYSQAKNAKQAAVESELRILALTPPQKGVDKHEIKGRIQSWKQSWLAGSTENYLRHYLPESSPKSGISYKNWLKDRKKKLPNRTLSYLEINNVVLELDEVHDKAISRFEQIFKLQGETRRRVITKQLDWKKVKNQWLIVQERILSS